MGSYTWDLEIQTTCAESFFWLLSQNTCKDLHESITYATFGIVTDDSAIFVANITCGKNFNASWLNNLFWIRNNFFDGMKLQKGGDPHDNDWITVSTIREGRWPSFQTLVKIEKFGQAYQEPCGHQIPNQCGSI